MSAPGLGAGENNEHLNVTHPAIRGLQQLLPDAIVSGGSFSEWLPHPASMSAAQRRSVFAAAKERAVESCLVTLSRLVDSGTSGADPITRTSGGRRWPRGYVGSLTHKGTIVLAALASIQKFAALGIDLERVDESLSPIASDIVPEGLPPSAVEPLALTFAFSAKEAVFKAQFPLSQQALLLGDVRLSWITLHTSGFEATAELAGLKYRVVGIVPQQPWVVCAAVSV